MLFHHGAAGSTGGNLLDICAAVSNDGNFMLGDIEVEELSTKTHKNGRVLIIVMKQVAWRSFL